MQYPNVLVLTTSNITEAIDLAFVDRADIKQYIGNPSGPARYQVLVFIGVTLRFFFGGHLCGGHVCCILWADSGLCVVICGQILGCVVADSGVTCCNMWADSGVVCGRVDADRINISARRNYST